MIDSTTFLKWMIVVGGFLSYFLADGCTYSSGILFTEFKDVFKASAAATALLPALSYAMPQFLSPVICPIVDAIGYSTSSAWGALFLCLSFIVTSFAQDISLTYFTYGCLMAIGLQLTYTAAFMAIVTTFKNDKWLGIACGVMTCGGGIGSFVANHLLVWILSVWTWREALILQGGLFLHAWIAAALFYWSDERSAILTEYERFETLSEEKKGPLGDEEQVENRSSETVLGVEFTQDAEIQPKRSCVDRLKKLWFLCPILLILTPPQQRSRVGSRLLGGRAPPKVSLLSQMRELGSQIRSSLACLFSRAVWTNAPLLTYVVANAMAAGGVVIPWTFVYDYVRSSWRAGLPETTSLSDSAESQIGWFPSLIGLGSCVGQVLFGIIISRVHNPSKKNTTNNGNMSNLTYVFGCALLLNALMTLSFTFAPLPSHLASATALGVEEVLIFATTQGRAFAAICFLLGVSDGAFMTLLGPMLNYYLDEVNFPAALGITLCITGLWNLAGTLIGGHMCDVLGTYYPSNLLAACLPLAGFLLLVVSVLIFRIRNNASVDFDTSTA